MVRQSSHGLFLKTTQLRVNEPDPTYQYLYHRGGAVSIAISRRSRDDRGLRPGGQATVYFDRAWRFRPGDRRLRLDDSDVIDEQLAVATHLRGRAVADTDVHLLN